MKESISQLRKYCIKFPWLHSNPYSLPATSPALEVVRNQKARAHWYLNVYLTIGYFGFVVFRTVQLYKDPTATLERQLHMTFMSVMYALVTFFNSVTLLQHTDNVLNMHSDTKFVGADGKLQVVSGYPCN